MRTFNVFIFILWLSVVFTVNKSICEYWLNKTEIYSVDIFAHNDTI